VKSIIRITTLTLAVTFLSAMILSAQEHNHDQKSDKKAESKTESHKMMDPKMMDKNNDGKVFQCSMCSDQISDKPGDCKKCGMKLSEVSVDDANKKMPCGEDGKMSCCGDKDMKDHSMKEANVVHKGTIEVAKIDMNKDGKVYQDMMDWNVISDKPGDCPLCGMKLKEVTISQAKKNLEKNGFKTQ